MRRRINSQCVFTIGFVILFPVLTFLSASLFVIRARLQTEITDLQLRMNNEIINQKFGLRAQLNNMTNVFSDEIGELKAITGHNAKLLHNLTDEFGKTLNQTIVHLNETITQESKQVKEKVINLTQDVGTYVNTTTDQFNSQDKMVAYQFAGTFTILGVLIFMYHLSLHLNFYREPFVQRKIMAMLWMVPIYSITSFCSLVFVSLEGYLAIIKDFYEAYCIFMFLSFLIAVLGRGDREAVVDLLAKNAEHLKPPLHFFGLCGKNKYDSPRHKADTYLIQCQKAALQFVVFRPATSIAMVITNHFIDGKNVTIWNVQKPQFYINMIQNISVFIAFSGLLKFYHAARDELLWCQPFPKFLCIKGVVFMTFWQGLVISIIAKYSFDDNQDQDAKEWSTQTQNLIVCLEMFFFAVAHLYVFPPEEWEEGYRPSETVRRKFGDNLALRDFVQDVKLVLQSKKKKTKTEPSEDGDDASPLQESSSFDSVDEKLGALFQMADEDDLSFINRIVKEAESLKLEEEKNSDGLVRRMVV